MGPKTATDLLNRFGSIADLYGRLAEIKSESQRSALTASTEVVQRNQKMVALQCGLTDGPALEGLVPGTPRVEDLREMYRRWNFRSLLAELGDPTVPQQGSLW